MQSKEEGKYQESIKLSSTPDSGHNMGKRQKHKKTSKREPRGQPFPSRSGFLASKTYLLILLNVLNRMPLLIEYILTAFVEVSLGRKPVFRSFTYNRPKRSSNGTDVFHGQNSNQPNYAP